MPKIDAQAKVWQKALARRLGEAVKARRNELKWSAAKLADRTSELGYPVSRIAISKLENNHREGKFDLAEIVALASALRVPPVTLLFGGPPDMDVEVLPNQFDSNIAALAWFTGDPELAWPVPYGGHANPKDAKAVVEAVIVDPQSSNAVLLNLSRQRAVAHREIASNAIVLENLNAQSAGFVAAAKEMGSLIGRIDELNQAISTAAVRGQESSE